MPKEPKRLLSQEEAEALAFFIESMDGYNGRLHCLIEPDSWFSWRRKWRVVIKGKPLDYGERQALILRIQEHYQRTYGKPLPASCMQFPPPLATNSFSLSEVDGTFGIGNNMRQFYEGLHEDAIKRKRERRAGNKE